MTHYEKRLEEDITRIRDRVHGVAEAVEKALDQAVRAVLTRNRELASQIILGDHPINREVRSLDRDCHAFVARHLPSAGHLRFVSSVLRLTVALERIGDYAVTIARETVQLSAPVPEEVERDLVVMAEQAARMLREAVDAFTAGNAERARGTKPMESQVDSTFRLVFSDLLRQGEAGTRPLKDLFGLLVIFNALERVTDQAKNICEETIFTVTGETKPPKTYAILFVDERNDLQSQLAEAFARKAFPGSGRYASAGWRPAASLDPRCREFLTRHGLDVSEAVPSALESLQVELPHYHVIVSLQGDPRPHMAELPFHTVLLEWDVGGVPEDRGRAEAALEETYKQVAFKVRELMETLRGPDAD